MPHKDSECILMVDLDCSWVYLSDDAKHYTTGCLQHAVKQNMKGPQLLSKLLYDAHVYKMGWRGGLAAYYVLCCVEEEKK